MPAEEHLESYLAALRTPWSPDEQRPELGVEQIAHVEADPQGFLHELRSVDPEGRTVTLPDGSVVPRLPSHRRWIWDGAFCGSIDLRWQPGTAALPEYCLGHIGYGVVPWKRGRGYATQALAGMLELAEGMGLPHVDIVTDLDNTASQRVVLANGGTLVRRFTKPSTSHGGEGLLFRVALPRTAARD